ncbi:MAG TPA: hypothetical protein VFA43_13830 [Gemmatimonadaceae bacterium]|nr:hypothetical protein [Gemmatimonadaceae bacterium]
MIARASHYLALLPKPSMKHTSASVGAVAKPKRDLLIQRYHGPWNPTNYELWVENGVIWDLQRTWILGFTDYPSIAQYFSQTIFVAAPQIFTGAPFSLNDFPVYGFQYRLSGGQTVPGSYYIFSSLSMLSYIPNAWTYFTAFGLTRHFGTTPPAGAGPLINPGDLRSFIAGTPNGQQTLSARYVMYVPPDQYWANSYHFWPVLA